MTRIVLFFLLLVVSTYSYANRNFHIVSGGKLYSQLTSDSLNQLQAVNYIMGAVDTLFPIYCIPPNAQIGKIVDLVKRALEENPSERHRPASDFIIVVLKKEYSCLDNSKPQGESRPPFEDRLRNTRPKNFI